MRVALTGSTGFVGSDVMRVLKERGHEVIPIHAPRLVETVSSVSEAIDRAAVLQREFAPMLDEALASTDVLINTAGLATPDAERSGELLGANTVLPVVLYAAARRRSVQRFVHVSSAAVQGRRPVLDETFEYDIRSPYAHSKALAEQALLQFADSDPRLVVYRATSVQALDRSVTRTLLRLAHLPVVPMVGTGDKPIPLALRPNCSSAIAHLAEASDPPALSIHPWEGMTSHRFFRLANPRVRLLSLPEAASEAAGESLWVAGRRVAAAAGMSKRLDLLVNGQRSTATSMLRTGFSAPLGDEAYAELGRQWRHERQQR